MSNFDKEDVLTVAKAMANMWFNWEYASSSYSDFDGYTCNFCDADKQEDIKGFKHELCCPTLVANDLLTGHKTQTNSEAG